PCTRTSLTSYVFHGEKTASQAVSDARYRFIRSGDGFEELYDLETDPDEFTNRAADPALAEVKARLAEALPSSPAPNRGKPAKSE
ncbi:MAG: iduronate-2-sulfatase, partial [Verrucomicrobiota bacterium]